MNAKLLKWNYFQKAESVVTQRTPRLHAYMPVARTGQGEAQFSLKRGSMFWKLEYMTCFREEKFRRVDYNSLMSTPAPTTNPSDYGN